MKRKRKDKRKFYLVIIVASIVGLSLLGFIFRRPIIYYSKIVYHMTLNPKSKLRTDFKKSNFDNIFIPNSSLYGIDISRHQGKIDWDMLAKFRFKYNKINFVYIKATESDDWTDKNFARNWNQAKKYNIIRGAYHFFDPDEDPDKQMKYFFKHVDIQSGDLPPMLDVEQESRISTSEYRKKVLKSLRLMEQHYGLKPILYVNNRFYSSYFSTEAFKEYPLWISQLTNQTPTQHQWVIWQFSHNGVLPGINEYVDLNVFNGSDKDFNILIKD